MRAEAKRHDPEFKRELEAANARLPLNPAIGEILFNADIINEINLAILNSGSPDFSVVAKRMRYLADLSEVKDCAEIEDIERILSEGYKLLVKFLPFDVNGLPSMDLWAWIIQCMYDAQIPNPEPSQARVFYSYDPDRLINRLEIEFLRQILLEKKDRHKV